MQKGIIKNVNKLTGEPIDAKDLASMLSGIIGNESGVLTVFDELRLEKISDNKVRLHSGVYSLKGHILYIPKGSYEDFEIESGTLGANRIDLLVAEYVKNGEGDGEDTLRFRVIKGKATSGTPEEPDLIQQDINENGITYQEILYRLSLKNNEISFMERKEKILNLNTLEKRIIEQTNRLESIESAFSNPFATVSTEWVESSSTDDIYVRFKPKTLWSPHLKTGISTNNVNLHIQETGIYAFMFTRTVVNGSKPKGSEVIAQVHSANSSDVFGEIIKFSVDNTNSYTHTGLINVKGINGGISFSTKCIASGSSFFQDGRLTIIKLN